MLAHRRITLSIILLVHLGEASTMRVMCLAQEHNTMTQACKAIFSYMYDCILKTEKCIDLKLCMKGTSLHIKNIMELNSSVIIRFEILLWLSGCKNFSGPLRLLLLKFSLLTIRSPHPHMFFIKN